MLLPKGLITVKMQTMQCLTTSTVQAKVFLSSRRNPGKWMLFWSWNLILVRGFESLFLLSNLFGVCVTSTTLKKCCRNVGKWDTFSGGTFHYIVTEYPKWPSKIQSMTIFTTKKPTTVSKVFTLFCRTLICGIEVLKATIYVWIRTSVSADASTTLPAARPLWPQEQRPLQATGSSSRSWPETKIPGLTTVKIPLQPLLSIATKKDHK